MERATGLTCFARGPRVAALVAALVLAGCGDGSGDPMASGGAGGHAGRGTAGSGGRGGGIGPGGASGGGVAGTTGSGGDAGGAGTSANGGASGGAAGAAGSSGAAGAAGTSGSGGDAGASGGASGGAGTGANGGAAGMAPTADGGTDASDTGVDAGNRGAACTQASDCSSNFCVDGVCCEAACSGACMACANAKTGQTDGLCLPIKGATDPDNECPSQGAGTCGTDGVCDGAGACHKWTAGTVCAAESCSGTTRTPARTCDGYGTCQTVTAASCSPYVCGAVSCKNTCTTGADCMSGNSCVNGTCVAPQQAGAACAAAGDCASGFCVDGVCCNTTCTNGCMACSQAKTGQASGTCAAIAAGTDPDNECTADAASSCGRTGMCNGAGACGLSAAGTVCVGGACSAGTETPARTCDGAGTCQTVTSGSCGAYLCGAAACKTACTASTDCVTGYFCSAGTCVAQEANGTACAASGDCTSGFCVDGVCCNSACTGSCQTCGAVGSVGTCSSAAAGTDPHSDCDAEAASTCGKDGMCDGAGACRKHVTGTTCQAAGCASGTLSAASTCDGAGVCTAGAQTSCNGYQCDATGTSCLATCTTDASCTGFCSAATCVAAPVNLAGNGDVEYGAVTGWTSNGGSVTAASGTGLAHGGTYSLKVSGRSQNYQGPSYPLPSGAGKYAISAWAMQNDDATLPVGFQVALNCGVGGTNQMFPGVGFTTLTQGVWTKITGTVDTSSSAACQPTAATPGMVSSATLYLNQNTSSAPTPVAFPNLFLDDVVVQVTDGHNLVGNPNFEAGGTDGWQNNGGGTLSVSTSVHNTGTSSLALTGRTQNYNGQRWNLPIGAAKYNVSITAQHNGALPHPLMIQPTYTCKGSASGNYPPAIGYTANTTGNTWYTLSGTVTFPPAAPAGCQLTSAGVYLQQGDSGACGGDVECPDLFIDDVSITLAQ